MATLTGRRRQGVTGRWHDWRATGGRARRIAARRAPPEARTVAGMVGKARQQAATRGKDKHWAPARQKPRVAVGGFALASGDSRPRLKQQHIVQQQLGAGG